MGGISVAVMIAAAGMFAPATLAQDTRTTPAGERMAHGMPDFRSVKWMRDRKVMNNNGEEIAVASDFIVDRGSGRIDYAVLRTGTILGMGGKQVAVAYPSLRWDASDEQFQLALTPEQLKALPEYSEEEWKGVVDTKATSKELRKRLTADAAQAAGDPYAASLEGAKEVRIKGEVTKVERVSRGEYGEHIVVTVRTPEGERVVALGPSWFVNSGIFAPMRGDQVTIEAVTLTRDPAKTLAARSMSVGDRHVVLRTENGSPAWQLKAEETPELRATAARRYLLVSSVVGSRVDCRGTECGKVHDVILDRRSGMVGFLSIDPNENFLGIADTKRLVPWSVATVASDGVVRIDASKEMVLASPETPSDLTTLNSGGVAGTVYKAYEVSAPKYEVMKETKEMDRGAADAWSREGSIYKAINRDSGRRVAGKQRDIDEVSLGGGLPPAYAITVEENGKDTLVLLGPAWYIKNQKLGCKDGENVTIETYRTKIDGKEYYVARTVECPAGRVVLIDESGVPAWDRK
jgi:sporulation protein YlmC with PRC-barrel domain